MNIPHGGQLCHYFKEWCSITHDREVLSYTAGIKIPFTDKLVLQAHIPWEIPMNSVQASFVDRKIEQLLADQCITKLDKPVHLGWISNIFLTPKQDGSFRLILNLKPLNKFIQYHKFKMETIHNAVNMLHKSWYLMSIDLKDAFSLLHMSHSYQTFLQFQWRGITYCYTAMPQGIAIGPITFVHTTKLLLAWLRSQGVHTP